MCPPRPPCLTEGRKAVADDDDLAWNKNYKRRQLRQPYLFGNRKLRATDTKQGKRQDNTDRKDDTRHNKITQYNTRKKI